MAKVVLEKLVKSYGDFEAVKGIDLALEDKEFVVLLGPSGCGKTTTLRCIAGLEQISSGKILFDGQRVDHLDPVDRNIAMVFQFFALYPHLKARQIIAFPLRARKLPKRFIQEKVAWASELFELTDILDKYVAGLTPGDKQKIALARAIVRDPNVLLLDEPLSALDEQYREEMRWQLGRVQKELKVTTIYVTHDQREAMSLADRIVLMRDGVLVQQGPPDEIYQYPASVFSGYFIGSPGMNFFDASFDGTAFLLGKEKRRLAASAELSQKAQASTLRELIIGIRPEYLAFSFQEPSTNACYLPVSIVSTEKIGHYLLFSFRIDEQIYQGMVNEQLKIEGRGFVSFKAQHVRLFEKTQGQVLN